MQLNSILFPAPSCSYSSESLKNELIWIPKYKKIHMTLSRHATQVHEDKHIRNACYHQSESKKHNIPSAKIKKTMPRTPTLDTKENFSRINMGKQQSKPDMRFDTIISKRQSKSGSKASAIKNKKNRFLFVPENKPCQILHQPSVLDMSDSFDGTATFAETEKHFDIDFKLEKLERTDSRTSSAEVSVELDEAPQISGHPILEKRFFQNSNISNKHSKASLTTNENSNGEVDCMNIPQEKKPSFTIDKITLCNEYRQCPGPYMERIKDKPRRAVTLKPERQLTIDSDSLEEFPDTLGTLSSPRTLKEYATKTFPKHNVGAEKKFVAARLLNQEFEKPKKGTSSGSLTSRNADKPNLNFSTFHRSTTNLTGPQEQLDYYIPCLYLKAPIETNNILVYFHGNGEDINLAYDLLIHLRDRLEVNILAMEYPGYGLYKGSPSDAQIQSDAETVFEYLILKLRIHPKNIILFGRSIGSGPATWLASRKNVGALVLMSAFTSIRAVVRDIAGKWTQYLIKERFNNLECMGRVTCPTFLVHGLRDSLISYKHSQELNNVCKGPCELVLPRNMDHIEFDFDGDFIEPLANFLLKCNFELRPKSKVKIELPKELFQPPKLLTKLSTLPVRS